ncbi:MAG: DNA topoisomerase, partial [Candidatus Acidiferrales bacterium]
MGRSLVIVESPAKAKTINKYLGRNYAVRASYGHVKDLPKKELGIDIAKNFEPTYAVIPGKSKILNELKKLGKEADAIYVATDPDREGEAIGAHLVEFLTGTEIAVEPEENNNNNGNGKTAKKGKKPEAKKVKSSRNKVDRRKVFRVMFHEITPKAIKAAFEHAGTLNTNLVDAQQARRVLDRLVGYKISPLLWDKVRRGLSAGRVQTVALRLIVDRERDIRAFVPKEYWTIHAMLAGAEPPPFEAKLWRYKGEEIEVPNEEKAKEIVDAVERASWQVSSVNQKEKRRWAPPPFTTSKLQQASYNRLRFSAKRTMTLAQRLYEGVDLGDEGSVALITYMRTDSVHVSNDAIAQVRDFVGSSYGPNYLPEKPNFFKSKKQAQEAHEAIRPTDVTRSPEDVKRYLDEDMFKLYQL